MKLALPTEPKEADHLGGLVACITATGLQDVPYDAPPGFVCVGPSGKKDGGNGLCQE